ncbi:NADH-quinone oxidoreductase subunit C [Roseobacter sp. N2S]|uniref:NADH-quinone oxidoreductase subunit C n=1 Tax=Roseobacter sp. N2S TaxID=2663844 RepID=UPI002860AC11|nr:NADH-quinone oxidoreductase subunit C [Roseobacter sp. N2S]MDR6264415.1 NADH-quinone oxidoreductase subunit C [Roseobacter sp. N2S]
MTEALTELGTALAASRSDAVLATEVTKTGELVVQVSAASLPDFIDYIKTENDARFSTLIDITAVDYPSRDKRFDVVYHFLSMYTNQRIRIKASVHLDEVVPSITSIHPSADWYEREVFDMYGIMFSGHPDLRRLLTDYGFRGYPLRKDFPTTGYTELRYDEVEKRVVYEPVSLVQEYRQFDFMSPWEGAEYILPGDEKKKEEAAK